MRACAAPAPSHRQLALPRHPAPHAHPLSPPQIRLLRFSEEDDEITCAAAWSHSHEVLDLAASTTDASLVATVSDALDGAGARATVWRLPGLPAADAAPERGGGGGSGAAPEPTARELERVADVPVTAGDGVARVAWAPHASGHSAASFVTAHGAAVRAWTLRGSGGAPDAAGAATFDAAAPHVGAAAWDPHHPNEVAVAAGAAVHAWDLRAGERTRAIEHAVQAGCGVVRALSFNPNRPWVIATAGDDFRVKIWDLRKPAAPLKVLEGHSHWCGGRRGARHGREWRAGSRAETRAAARERRRVAGGACAYQDPSPLLSQGHVCRL
jgi:hypothetical protein